MYKSDKVIISTIFVVLFMLFFLLEINVYEATDSIITIVSILLGFYMTAISTIYGKKFIHDMAIKVDKKLVNKTELKILINYFQNSVVFAVITMGVSLVIKLTYIYTNVIVKYVFNIISFSVVPLLAISLYLMLRLFKLFMNGLYKEAIGNGDN